MLAAFRVEIFGPWKPSGFTHNLYRDKTKRLVDISRRHKANQHVALSIRVDMKRGNANILGTFSVDRRVVISI